MLEAALTSSGLLANYCCRTQPEETVVPKEVGDSETVQSGHSFMWITLADMGLMGWSRPKYFNMLQWTPIDWTDLVLVIHIYVGILEMILSCDLGMS